MAREGITRAQVFNAADAISVAGQAPTVANVRAKLGTGSYTTITALLREWKEQTVTGGENEALDVPEEVHGALGRAAEIVWKAATEHFAHELATIRKEAERAQAESAATLNDALAEIRRLEDESEASANQISTLRSKYDAATEHAEKLKYDNTEQRVEIKGLKLELKMVQERLEQQTTMIERMLPVKKEAGPKPAKRSTKKTPPDDPTADTRTIPMDLPQ